MQAEAILGAAAVSGGALCLWWSVAGDRRLRGRAAENLRVGLRTDVRDQVLAAPASDRAQVPLLERVAHVARRLTPAGAIDGLNRRIMRAGMSSSWPVDRTLAAKLILGGVGAVLGLLLMTGGTAAGVLFGLSLPMLMFFAPDEILRLKAVERQKRIRIALPDTLDQITVCVEAGLGFEGALARAARTGDGPLAEEIVRTLQDVQLGVPRKEAMRGLADRNAVDELKQFVLAIIQAEGFGVPIARVLRIHANELREKRRQAAEERAMKISVKMLLPLVTCILPTVFIVMIGPAIFELAGSLSHPPT